MPSVVVIFSFGDLPFAGRSRLLAAGHRSAAAVSGAVGLIFFAVEIADVRQDATSACDGGGGGGSRFSFWRDGARRLLARCSVAVRSESR